MVINIVSDPNMAENGMGLIPGLGDNKPQSRLLGKSFFGYVPDAFSMKTPAMPSEKPSQKDSKVSIIIQRKLVRSVCRPMHKFH
jgi:hypothetical protein